MEKRKRHAEEMKASRLAADSTASSSEPADTSALDNLLEKLRNGDSVGRKARRNRVITPTPVITSETASDLVNGDPSDLAKDMLARLKSEGFDGPLSPIPPSPRSMRHQSRRNRLRMSDFSGTANALDEESEVDVEHASSSEFDDVNQTLSRRSSNTSDALGDYLRSRRDTDSTIVSPRLPTQTEDMEPEPANE